MKPIILLLTNQVVTLKKGKAELLSSYCIKCIISVEMYFFQGCMRITELNTALYFLCVIAIIYNRSDNLNFNNTYTNLLKKFVLIKTYSIYSYSNGDRTLFLNGEEGAAIKISEIMLDCCQFVRQEFGLGLNQPLFRDSLDRWLSINARTRDWNMAAIKFS